MNVTSSSRDEVLRRIRAATAGRPKESGVAYASLPRTYQMRGALSAKERISLMSERLWEYDAEVVECVPAAVPDTIRAQVEKSGRRVLAAPSGLPQDWMVSGCEWRVDRGLTHAEIEQADGVVTAASCGIAESGTIVLHHEPAEGRRVLSLLPEWHLCVLFASQIVETLPEYFHGCGTAPALATFISGPSATADIEMTRIKGVHGPRFLSVIVVHDK
jgi:L-lactate dehydrogenase complex protein LldG